MRVIDLSPTLVHGAGTLVGVAGGFAAARLADVLPRRYDITHVAPASARTRRNVLLVVVNAALGLGLAHLLTLAGNTSLERTLFYFAFNQVLCTGLVTAAAVDFEHMILPNEATLGGAALALATAHWRGLGLLGSIVGTVVGLALTYLPAALYKRLRGRSGMGFGDAKLALLAGAWLGAEGAVFVVFAGAMQSALASVIMRMLGVTFAVPASVRAELADLRAKAAAGDEEARALLAEDPMAADVGEAQSRDLATMRLPMGPFLVIACLEFVFARRQILDLFDRYVAPR